MEPSKTDIRFDACICKHCHVGLLEDHPTLREYFKCESCGFCPTKHSLQIVNKIEKIIDSGI